MKKSLKKVYYSIILVLLFSLITLSQSAYAESCPGMSPLTDPLAIRMENGETVIWENVHKDLLLAKQKYEQLLKEKGWTIQYTSAYRPFQYQKHLYEIVTGPSNSCKSREKSKHGLGPLVAAPSMNAPHTQGIAFDAIVKDKKGKALNGMNFVNSALVGVAKQAGLFFPHPGKDGVHHQLINPSPSDRNTSGTKIGTGIVITKSTDLNVRSGPGTNYKVIATVKKGQKVNILKIENDWYYIQAGNITGYVLKNYIQLDNSSTPPTTNKEVKIDVKIQVSIYLQPTFTSESDGAIAPQTVTVIEQRDGGWLKIKTWKGDRWINPSSTINKNAIITAPSGLNVRSGPGTNYARIGGVYKNNQVFILEKLGDWYKIKFGNGIGYIYNDGILIEGEASKVTSPINKSNSAFEEALAFVLDMEKGWNDNPNDRGGLTNFGITQSTYDHYLKMKKKASKNVKYITKEEVKDIYYQFYWKEIKGDRYERPLAIVMFDTAVYVGPYGSTTPYRGGAIKFLQQVLGLYGDGSWGPKTEAAFVKLPKSKHYETALKILELRRKHHYEDVRLHPDQKVFLEGWVNRTNKLTNYIKMNYGN